MADYFKEQIIKTSMDAKSRGIKIVIGVVIIVAILGLIPYFAVGLLLVIGVFFLDYKYSKLFAAGFIERDLEYEYIATNSSFEVDRVINKSNRKHEIDLEMKEIIWFGKLDNPKLLGQAHGAEIKNLSNLDNKNNDSKYAFITMYKGKKTQVIFEPNEEMVAIFKVFVPKHAIEL